MRDTFPDAWGNPPTESRLMHGAGIRAMGRLMDRIMATVEPRDERGATSAVRDDLALVAPHCRWTPGPGTASACAGTGPEHPRHINELSNYLIRVLPAGEGRAAMRFFFPDSQDQMDPSFDFVTEERVLYRVRQRDDLYAHEALRSRRSTACWSPRRSWTDCPGPPASTPSPSATPLPRRGPQFFRLDRAPGPRLATWVTAARSPTSARRYRRTPSDEVIDFYDECGFDYGISVDHVILGYDPAADQTTSHPMAAAWRTRR